MTRFLHANRFPLRLKTLVGFQRPLHPKSYPRQALTRAQSLSCGCFDVFRKAKREIFPEKEKGPTRVGPVTDQYSASDPIPTTPGGWGLRNPASKGPGQRRNYFSQASRARGGQKWGRIMIPLTMP